MREIKYRFFWKEKMYAVDFIHFIEKTVGFRYVNESLKLEGGFVKIEEGILMQSTGLFDKNGKEIYDGDIVTLDNYNKNRWEVHYQETFAGFNLRTNRNSWYAIGGANGHMEIIGNIYETPNLIK